MGAEAAVEEAAAAGDGWAGWPLARLVEAGMVEAADLVAPRLGAELEVAERQRLLGVATVVERRLVGVGVA